MFRIPSPFVAVGLFLSVATTAHGQSPVYRSALHDFQLVTVADGLVNPWSIAFLPDGDMLVTERPGRLRIVRNGTLLFDPVPGVPEVLAQGQGGLLDVMPHPDFASNHLLYLSYSKPIGDGSSATTAVMRGTFANDRLSNVEEIFEAASSRLARELAAMEKTDEPTALEKILDVLREHAPQYYENTEDA